jgi:hypothetical protein
VWHRGETAAVAGLDPSPDLRGCLGPGDVFDLNYWRRPFRLWPLSGVNLKMWPELLARDVNLLAVQGEPSLDGPQLAPLDQDAPELASREQECGEGKHSGGDHEVRSECVEGLVGLRQEHAGSLAPFA